MKPRPLVERQARAFEAAKVVPSSGAWRKISRKKHGRRFNSAATAAKRLSRAAAPSRILLPAGQPRVTAADLVARSVPA
jgi:hypothetical protein